MYLFSINKMFKMAKPLQRSLLFARTHVRFAGSDSKSRADFGFRDVDSHEKEKLVREVFSKVARRYDVMNDMMSAGTHRLWKDEFVSMMGLTSAAKAEPTRIPRCLDVAGGTGDIAFRITEQLFSSFPSGLQEASKSSLDLSEDSRQVVVCDINPDMLAVGKDRAPRILGKDRSSVVISIFSLLLCLHYF